MVWSAVQVRIEIPNNVAQVVDLSFDFSSMWAAESNYGVYNTDRGQTDDPGEKRGDH